MSVQSHPLGTSSRKRRSAWRAVKRHLLTLYAILVLVYLMLPIGVVILFSFNQPEGRFNYVWQGFTLDNWVEWDSVLGIRQAVITSLEVGILATIVATALGTLMALALVRHQFRGRATTNVLVFLPMSTPEIVLGASLLTLFLNTTTVFTLGFWTIFIAHVMFVVSYIVVTVKARLIGFDRLPLPCLAGCSLCRGYSRRLGGSCGHHTAWRTLTAT